MDACGQMGQVARMDAGADAVWSAMSIAGVLSAVWPPSAPVEEPALDVLGPGDRVAGGVQASEAIDWSSVGGGSGPGGGRAQWKTQGDPGCPCLNGPHPVLTPGMAP